MDGGAGEITAPRLTALVLGRAKVKTTGKPGSRFTDNTVDAMMVFHQETGAWKSCDEEILGVQTSP